MITRKKFYLVAILLLLSVTVCFAKTVNVTSLKYSLEIPDGYSTDLTYIKNRSQYFAAHHPEERIVITISSTAYKGTAFESLTDAKVRELGKSTKSQMEAYGITVLSYDVYKPNGIKFLKLEAKASGLYQIQYSAVKNGKLNNFTFTMKSSPTSSDLKEIKGIVDSIKNT